MIFEYLFPFFEKYGILISFLGGLFGGETAIISLSFLSANGLFPLWWILVFTTIGEFISDIFVFLIGRMHFISNLTKLEKSFKVYRRIDKIIVKLSRDNIFLVILYGKFIYGASIFGLLYLGIKKKNIIEFLIADFIVVCMWIIILVTIGWLGGHGFNFIITIFNNIKIAIFLLLLFVLILISFQKWLNKKLINVQKQ